MSSVLSLDSLKSLGGFTGAPVEREIEFEIKGVKHNATVYVRPLSYHSMVSDLKAMGGNGEAVAGRIAASICDAEGKPVLTEADITGAADPGRGPLDGSLVVALLAVIGEVNGLGKPKS